MLLCLCEAIFYVIGITIRVIRARKSRLGLVRVGPGAHIGLWAQWSVDTFVCGHNGLWAQWSVGTLVCGHHGLWHICLCAHWFVGTMVCGHINVYP